jgi:uncharacterized RDD family membrane protein YckC
MEELTKKRFWAFIIDFIFITALMWILSIVVYPFLIVTGFFSVFNYWLLILALLIIGYFTYLEGSYSKTVGKSLMGIGLKALDENLTYKKTFLRNLSKILWFPIIIDLLAAYFTKNNSLRILDKYAGTVVVIDE